MAPTLAWTNLTSWIFATTTANGHFARSAVAVKFALTAANGRGARSVGVAVFALTTAIGTAVQFARVKPRDEM